jgi:hypothetical protein
MWLNPKVRLLTLPANARLQVEVSPHTLLKEENYRNKKFCNPCPEQKSRQLNFLFNNIYFTIISLNASKVVTTSLVRRKNVMLGCKWLAVIDLASLPN